MTNAVPGQDTNVNVKFGSGSSFVSVPVSGSTITTSSGTLDVSFNVPTSICDNVADIQHQIKCYEQVTLADGSQVSSQTARDMILACGTGGTTGGGTNSTYNGICADDYPQEACVQISNSKFVLGSSCAASFPSASSSYDYGCSTSGVSSWTCGTCGVGTGTASANTEIKAAGSSITAEDAIYNALNNAVNNPEANGLTVTFTPAE